MFSSVLFRKLFIASFLVMVGLASLLCFFCTHEIRQAAKGARASLAGFVAENLFDRIGDRYDHLKKRSGMPARKPSEAPFQSTSPKTPSSIMAEDLASLVSDINLPDRGRLYIVDGQGHLTVHSPADLDRACIQDILAAFSEPAEADERPAMPAHSSGETIAGPCTSDRRKMVWTKPLGEDGLRMVFIMDPDPATRFPRGIAARFIWGAIVLLACCAFFLAALIRNCLKRLWVIGDMAREFVQNGRISENRYVAGVGEIGTLGAAIYHMTEKLAEKRQTILDQTRAQDELLKDVEGLRERTHKLYRENEKLKRRFEVIREKQESLRRSEERYRTMLENIEEYFYEADLSGNLLFFNDALYRMLGYARERLIGMNFREFMDRGTTEKAFRIFRKAYETGQAQKGIGWRLLRKDGSACHIEISVSLIRNLAGEIIGFRGVARNVSELIYLVYHDSLTGLYNRKAFFERIQETLAIAKRDQKEKNIFYLDLDEFKRVNDEYGHHVGDEVLKEVAARLKASLRETDHVCRIGGDEFVVILNNLKDDSSPEEAAGRVLDALSRPYRVQGHSIDFITPSIGISTYPGDSDNVEALVRCADIAMFKAKRAEGGGCYVFYEKTMGDEMRSTDNRDP